MTPTTTTVLRGELAASADELAQHLETVRAGVRAINALGALASRLQGVAQDAEFDATVPAQRQALQDLLQRTGYVNLRSGDLATKMRDLHQGILDLQGNVAAARTAFPPAEGEP